MKLHEQQYYPSSEKLKFETISSEEERDLFRRLKTDDAVRELLIKRHLLYALKKGREFGSKLPVDDSTSAANFGLMKAIDNFDPDRGTSFRAFLRPFIRAEIARAWKAREVVSFKNSEPPPQSNSETPTHVDYDKFTQPMVEQEDHDQFLRDALQEISQSLPERERQVVHLHYVELMNYAQIGRQLKLSREAIRLIHDKVLLKLKKRLVARGINSSQ